MKSAMSIPEPNTGRSPARRALAATLAALLLPCLFPMVPPAVSAQGSQPAGHYAVPGEPMPLLQWLTLRGFGQCEIDAILQSRDNKNVINGKSSAIKQPLALRAQSAAGGRGGMSYDKTLTVDKGVPAGGGNHHTL